tara:strand:+ start:164 stop:607 length:444 start_codon:yes stop_codon:yes gene_type:complete
VDKSVLNFKKIENICAIVLLVAFFLPWVSFFGMSVSGYSIPGIASGLGQFGSAMSGEAASVPWQVYLVYLVPLTAIGVLVTDFLKTDENIARIVSILAGVVPLAGVIYMLIESGGELFSYLGFGAYLTILAAIGMLLATFGIVKSPE